MFGFRALPHRCPTSVGLGRGEAAGGASARACGRCGEVPRLLYARRAPWDTRRPRAQGCLVSTHVARGAGRPSEGARFPRLALGPVSPVALGRLLRLNKTEELIRPRHRPSPSRVRVLPGALGHGAGAGLTQTRSDGSCRTCCLDLAGQPQETRGRCPHGYRRPNRAVRVTRVTRSASRRQRSQAHGVWSSSYLSAGCVCIFCLIESKRNCGKGSRRWLQVKPQ